MTEKSHYGSDYATPETYEFVWNVLLGQHTNVTLLITSHDSYESPWTSRTDAQASPQQPNETPHPDGAQPRAAPKTH